jgi:hypothetical protein
MANTILHKRSSTASAVPAAGALTPGELAINTADGKAFTKKDNGTVVEIGGVTSVAGRQGAVTLTKTDVGLDNVDNTSDANKPVSTATQTALNGKANSTHTHAQSDITNLVSDLAAKAPLASPALTGTPTAPTAAANTNSTQVATTAYVQSELAAGDLKWNGAGYTVSTSAPSGGVDGDFWFERVA